MEASEPAPIAVPKTLQIALCSGGVGGIKAGLRTFPVSKLTVIYEAQRKGGRGEGDDEMRRHVEEFLGQLRETLGIDAEVRAVASPGLEAVLDALREVKLVHKSYDDVMVNLTEGGKMLACSALSSAFILGMQAFTIDDGRPYLFPVLKLGYYHTISEAKLGILKAIQKTEAVNSLEELANMTGYDRAEVSRHINGSSDSKGLLQLSLVTVERRSHGRLSVGLSPLGKILLMGSD